jgi:hypothetical protein
MEENWGKEGPSYFLTATNRSKSMSLHLINSPIPIHSFIHNPLSIHNIFISNSPFPQSPFFPLPAKSRATVNWLKMMKLMKERELGMGDLDGWDLIGRRMGRRKNSKGES